MEQGDVSDHQLLHLLLERCLYSELFWFAFSRIGTEYVPEQLRIRTLFTQCLKSQIPLFDFSLRVVSH